MEFGGACNKEVFHWTRSPFIIKNPDLTTKMFHDNIFLGDSYVKLGKRPHFSFHFNYMEWVQILLFSWLPVCRLLMLACFRLWAAGKTIPFLFLSLLHLCEPTQSFCAVESTSECTKPFTTCLSFTLECCCFSVLSDESVSFLSEVQ